MLINLSSKVLPAGDFEPNKQYKSTITHALRNSSKIETVSFGYDLFLKKFAGLHCAYCNRKLITHKELEYFKKELPNLSGQKAIELLTEFGQELINAHKQVKEILVTEIRETPEVPVSKILERLASRHEDILIESQAPIYERILTIAKDNLSENSFTQIKSCLFLSQEDESKGIREALKTNKPPNKMLYRKLSEMLELNVDKKERSILRQLIGISKELPKSYYDSSAFIVKNSKAGAESFSEILITQLLPTADHIITRNEQRGLDFPSNLLNTCNHCNHERGCTPFSEWIIKKPSIIQNIVKYFYELQEFLFRKKFIEKIQLSGIKENYLIALQTNVKNAARGQLDSESIFSKT